MKSSLFGHSLKLLKMASLKFKLFFTYRHLRHISSPLVISITNSQITDKRFKFRDLRTIFINKYIWAHIIFNKYFHLNLISWNQWHYKNFSRILYLLKFHIRSDSPTFKSLFGVSIESNERQNFVFLYVTKIILCVNKYYFIRFNYMKRNKCLA